jgi:hypothetical protein
MQQFIERIFGIEILRSLWLGLALVTTYEFQRMYRQTHVGDVISRQQYLRNRLPQVSE